MDENEQKIKSLIREDYSFPLLQELLAELVVNTQHLTTQAPSKRYEKIISGLLGSPKEVEKHLKRSDQFVYDLRQASLLYEYSKRHTDTPLTKGEAAAEIARQRHISDYKVGDPIPKLSDQVLITKIESYTRRLKNNMEKISTAEYSKAARYIFDFDEHMTATHD